MGRPQILSAALLSAGGLLWDGMCSSATAQTYSGASNEVVVNYDVLNSLPAPYGAQGGRAGSAPGGQGGLAAPPTGALSSVLTTIGPDGRPITPIKLKRPGSPTQSAQKPNKEPAAEGAPSDDQVAAVSPPTEPAEPAEVPAQVPMPEPTPPAPAPSVSADTPPAAPAVETPTPPAEAATTAANAPAPEQSTEQSTDGQPAEEQPAQEQAAQEQAAQEQPAAETPAEAPPAEGEAAESETTEDAPTEEAAETPPEPDNSQPASPIPQGGIRIVFPTELNEVPTEANAALDDLAGQMLADETMRIQIMCYASGTADTESKARRKSLARCINIRQYLFKKDVRTTRMDVRALGLKSEGQPADRVDIVPANS
jgi:hypothetical protein